MHSSRHGLRGRGSSWRPRGRPAATNTPATPAPPLGDIVTTFELLGLKTSSSTTGSLPLIKNCTYAASFNWLESPAASILVPGLPPTWTPPKTPMQLQEDAGEYYRDINAAKYPKHPMEPAVKASLESESSLIPHEIDIFACGSTFGNLLRFARQEDKSFRMLVEVIGDTMFLVRRENSPKEVIQDVRGYGHSMPEAYTTWQKTVKGSTSHQRIIRYSIGGLQCLVRFEADGFLPDLCPGIGERAIEAEDGERNTDLGDALSALDTGTSKRMDTDTASLSTRSAGSVVSQASLFDLKTRSIKRQGEDFLAEQLPRLWITQVPNFVLGFHERGKFTDVQVKSVAAEVKMWETQHLEELEIFVQLLRQLVDFARGRDGITFELEYAGDGSLRAREVEGEMGTCVSEMLKKSWSREPATS